MGDAEPQPELPPEPRNTEPGTDARAQEITPIYMDVVRRMDAFARRRDLTFEEVREVTQRCSQKLWELWFTKAATFTPPDNPKQFAERTVLNHCMNLAKQRKRWAEVIDEHVSIDDLDVGGTHDPLDDAIAGELQQRIDRGRDTMPRKLRAAWDLWWAGSSAAQVATALGIKVKTAQNHIAKANRLLAAFLKPYTEEGR
jgi:DNA-directed RNA polymerase specialized sigma24 family protein